MTERISVVMEQERLGAIQEQLMQEKDHEHFPLAESLLTYLTSTYESREKNEEEFLGCLESTYGCSLQAMSDADTLWDGPLQPALKLLFGAERGAELLDLLQRRLKYSYSSASYYRKGYRSRHIFYYKEALLQLISLYYQNIAYNFSVMDYLTLRDKVLYHDTVMSYLIAREIDTGNEAVIEALRDIMFGDNQTVLLTRQMIRGIVMSHNIACYDMLIQLLLAAKLQEGLRQHIVESLDEGTLEATVYIMKVILSENLERFSSVIRALDTWTGLGFSDQKPTVIRKCLEQALRSLTDESYLREAENSNDSLVYYFALWAAANIDVDDAIVMIERVLNEGPRYKKMTALYFLSQLDQQHIKHHAVANHLTGATGDLEQLAWMVDCYYYDSYIGYGYNWEKSPHEFHLTHSPITEDRAIRREQFMALQHVLQQLKGASQAYEESVFPWVTVSLSADDIIKRMMTLNVYDRNEEMTDILIDYYDRMGSDLRFSFLVNVIGYAQTGKPRQFLMTALSDKSTAIREAALKIMHKLELADDELEKATALLKLKTGTIRQVAVQLLLKQADSRLQTAISTLISASNEQQRLAGLEIVNLLQQDGARLALFETTLSLVEQHHGSGRATSQEQVLIDKLLNKSEAQYSLANGFGLYDPTDQVSIPPAFDHPAISGIKVEDKIQGNPAAKEAISCEPERIIAVYTYFAALIEKHQDYEYEAEYYSGHKEKVLLGNQTYRIQPLYREQSRDDAKEVLDQLPLAEIWRQAAKELGLTPSFMLQILFADMELCKAYDNDQEWFIQLYSDLLVKEKAEQLEKALKNIKYTRLTKQLIELLLEEAGNESLFRLCMDIYVSLRSRMSVEQCAQNRLQENSGGYRYESFDPALASELLEFWLRHAGDSGEDEPLFQEWYYVAFASYRLMEYKDSALLQGQHFARATELGLMTESHLLREILAGNLSSYLIRTLTHAKWGSSIIKSYPWIVDVVGKAAARIVEMESRRGDMPTEVSEMAKNIQRFEGMRHFTDILTGLGKETFQRGYSYGSNLTKKEVLSSLLQSCYPAEGENAELLAELLTDSDIKEQRLLEAAMYAPQWVDIVQQYLGWPGLKSAAWYFHAHVNASFSAQKETEVAIFSPISPQSFNDGAFDGEWFKNAYKQLGEKRFEMLYSCAKYITDGGNSHRRAQLFADATLGKLVKPVLIEEIRTARNKDKLLSYTLLPIEPGDKQEALERYEFVQQFLKESKQFGAQRRESEGKICAIALENLARSSGYDDVNRMMWDLEAEKLAELELYFSPQEVNGVHLWLDIDDEGTIELKVEKAGKALKSVPAAMKKHEQVILLKEIQKSLKDQHTRARQSFEQSMENGTIFTAKELGLITRNRVIAPLVHHLVWFCADNQAVGYLHESDGSFSLRMTDGTLQTLIADAKLSLAHPVHLYESGEWSAFQRDLFERQLKQPFKQVFREYYRLDPDEKAAGIMSHRYAGHQVQPQRTVALLRGRLWTVDYEEGLQKVYYKENLIARMYAMADWFSPADIEPPTLETVQFFDRETMKPVHLEQVPAIIFSEVMRDVDLVVSVAHAGGVDPEASHSTIEMRSAIARELLSLLKVDNVRIEGAHAHIVGQLGEYSVHMGSGIVHKKGTGALHILPVHSQSRGRLFLPFADSDPRTAEIMSKLVLLADDHKIKDPSILGRM